MDLFLNESSYREIHSPENLWNNHYCTEYYREWTFTTITQEWESTEWIEHDL